MKYLLYKFEARNGKFFDNFDALWAILVDMGTDKANGRIYCVIDALDECNPESQKTLLAQITQSSQSTNIRFLITSRPYPEIRDYLRRFQSTDLSSYKKAQHAIQVLIQHKVSELSGMKRYSENVTQTVSSILQEKAQGTFLWVGIACDELKDVRPRHAVKTLENLPQGLGSLYAKILEQALEDNAEDEGEKILQMLSTVVVARRPLSIAELSAACGFSQDEDETCILANAQEEIEMCRQMIIVQDGIVRLLHKSVKDFLLRFRGGCFFNELKANATMSYRCIDYLLYNIKSKTEIFDETMGRNFYSYATRYWPDHAAAAGTELEVLPEHIPFFRSDEGRIWVGKVYEYPEEWYSSIAHVAAYWDIPKLLDLAVSPISTFDRIKTYFITNSGLLNENRGGLTPLYLAIQKQNTHAIDFLLRQGADTEVLDGQSKRALHHAVESGNEGLVQLFIRKSRNIDAEDFHGRSPLLLAVKNSHVGIVQLLLNAGARFQYVTAMRQNALHIICETLPSESSCKLLRLFIDMGVPTFTCDVRNMTALLYAVESGSEDFAEILLENGVDINYQIHRQFWVPRIGRPHTFERMRMFYELREGPNDIYDDQSLSVGGALHFSAIRGQARMTEFLLLRGADPNAQCGLGDTPLHLAIRRKCMWEPFGEDAWTNGNRQIEMSAYVARAGSRTDAETWGEIYEARVRTIDSLLSSDAIDVNIANNEGNCPLHEIPFNKEPYASSILLNLINRGGDVSKVNKKLQTCLHLASTAGDLDSVRILMNKGCRTDIKDIDVLNPLHCAIDGGNPAVVQSMLDHVLEYGRLEDYLDTKLLHRHVKSYRCSVEMINLLSKYGFGMNELDAGGRSVISLYLSSSHEFLDRDVFLCLLENGAELDWVDPKMKNLMHTLMHQSA